MPPLVAPDPGPGTPFVPDPGDGGNNNSGGGGSGTTNNKTPDTRNDKLDKALELLLAKLGITEIGKVLQAMLNGQTLNFASHENFPCLMGLLPASAEVINFWYNPNELNSITEHGLTVACLHEMYHLYRFDNGTWRIENWFGLTSDQQQALLITINQNDHQAQVNDPNYLEWLKEALPGSPDSEYDYLRYAGTIGTPVFDDLSSSRKNEISSWLLKNGFF
ncbi:MAG: hypothetical protein LUD68_03020 [Rikenellaceae bacterium]|nr:hypothetical protein [Rikenellaceae bacterium]